MPEDPLVTELRELGELLAVPPAPDVRAAVRARLPARPPRHRRWRAIAVAVAAALLIAVVPPARAAVGHAVSGLFNFAGVRVQHGQPAPARTPSPLPSLRSAGLDEARGAVHFPVRLPARLGTPDQVLLADPAPDGAPRVVTLLYRAGTVRLDEFDGHLDQLYLKTQPDPDLHWVDVGGQTGIWFPGPHAVVYIDRLGNPHQETARLAGPTLIWTDDTVTYRLEGFNTLDDALAVALSLR